MNNKDILLKQLRTLGLTTEEGRLYIELLKEPSTHLRLAHATGINRTKVYRLVDELEKRSLITKRTDDRGTFLVAADPATLEVSLVNLEKRLEKQKAALSQLLPTLAHLQRNETSAFVVLSYEGIDGFKQMLWHELKTKGDNVLFGGIPIEEIVPDHAWAEKHRAMTVEAGYIIRELINPGQKERPFTENAEYMKYYSHRRLPRDVIDFEEQLSVYNDTVATYHWKNGERVGFEVMSDSYARMMRQIFEHYWQLAESD